MGIVAVSRMGGRVCRNRPAFVLHHERYLTFKPSRSVYEASSCESTLGEPAHSVVHKMVSQTFELCCLNEDLGLLPVFQYLWVQKLGRPRRRTLRDMPL